MLNAGLAAVFPSAVMPVFAVSALYYMIFAGFSAGVIQLSSMLLAAVLQAAFFKGSKKDSPVWTALLVSGSLLFFSVTVLSVSGASAEMMMVYVINSVMTGCFVYASLSLINEYRLVRTVVLGGANGFYAAIIYIMTVSVLSGTGIVLLDPGRTLGCFVLLTAAKRYRMTGGAAVGALTSCAVFIGAPALSGNTLLLATAGLICGAFAELGVLAVSLSFIVVMAAGLAAMGTGQDAWHMFIDAAAGALVFAAVPQGCLRRLTARFFGGRLASDTIGRATASRLGYVSSSLSEIRSQLAAVSAAMDRKTSRPSLSETVFETMCRSCELKGICHRDPALSASRLEKLEQTAMCYSGVSDRDVSGSFPDCRFPELMSDSFNYAYKNYLDSRAAKLHISELRSLISEQLLAMEDILADLSFRVGRIRAADRELSERVRGLFGRLGYPNARACVYIDETGFTHAEIFISGEFSGDGMQLALAVSDITDCMLALPVVSEADGLTRILLSQQSVYELERGSFTASSSDSGCSGDTFDEVVISGCERYAVLSDGMGTGQRARLDSMFAVSLASRLLTAGVSMRSALRMINTVLKVKGWDESFATLDIMRFDLCAGRAELLKAGAAPTYLYRDGVLRRFGGQAMPAGILDSLSPDEFECKLFDGDMLLLLSDGVSDRTVREVMSEAGEGSADPDKVAQSIGERAMKESGAHRDDISVAVYRIRLAAA